MAAAYLRLPAGLQSASRWAMTSDIKARTGHKKNTIIKRAVTPASCGVSCVALSAHVLLPSHVAVMIVRVRAVRHVDEPQAPRYDESNGRAHAPPACLPNHHHPAAKRRAWPAPAPSTAYGGTAEVEARFDEQKEKMEEKKTQSRRLAVGENVTSGAGRAKKQAPC